MKRQTAIEIICFLFIFLFVYAAVSKLMDVEKFRITIGQSPLLANIAVWIAWLVPSVEILFAVMLAIPRLRYVGLLASLTLMVMFTTYIFIILNFNEHVPCSCGGVLQRLGWRDHLIFNLVFVGLGITGVILQYAKTIAGRNSIKDILLQ